ncbi:MAG: PepSY-like domain-containing protein [Ferruginibacter sp.]
MKVFVILLLITSSVFSASAQKIEGSKVPVAVKFSFVKKYPDIIPKWEKEKYNYEANFKQNGQTMSVIIDPNGNIIETETAIKITELPSTVLAYIKEHYKDKTIKEGAKIIKADGTVTYEAEVSGMDLIFDTNGKFIKQTKD